MHNSLQEKINYEFDKFKIEKIRQSKPEIFASSYEIETKKLIKDALLSLPDADADRKLLDIPYLLDYIYMELQHRQKDNECIIRIIRIIISGDKKEEMIGG